MPMILKSFKEYYLVWLALAAAIFCCVFLWYQAVRSSRARRARQAALVARLDREKALREEFQTPTRALLLKTPANRLVEGLCGNVQRWLDAQPDMRAAFQALPKPCRWVYALGYVIQDSRLEDGSYILSEFFRKNGEPLLTAAMEAVQEIVGGEYAEIFNHLFAAFDNENETVSLLDNDVLLQDARFYGLHQESENAPEDLPYLGVKDYILANADYFTNSRQFFERNKVKNP
jgi:hypothetical protein